MGREHRVPLMVSMASELSTQKAAQYGLCRQPVFIPGECASARGCRVLTAAVEASTYKMKSFTAMLASVVLASLMSMSDAKAPPRLTCTRTSAPEAAMLT